MANKNFIVRNGMTVGNLTIDATTGNITTTGAITSSGTQPLTSTSGIQSTPIGNVTPSSANFTTVVANTSATVAALTVNGAASVGGNLTVSGNLVITGNLITSNVSDLSIDDSIIYLASNNAADSLDSGIVAAYNDGSHKHTGLARDHADGAWKFFTNLATEPTTVVDWASATYANLKVGGATLTGSATIASTLGVTGNVNALSGLAVTSSATIGGTLGVTGVTTHSANISGTGLALSTSATVGTTLGVSGNVNALSGLAVTSSATVGTTLGLGGNLTGTSATLSGSLTVPTLGVSGTATFASTVNLNGTTNTHGVLPATNATYDIGSSSFAYNTVYAKATSAQYADLAENYLADAYYGPGTVVEFGGDAEVTICNTAGSTRVAGVVSTDPAYLMNSAWEGAGQIVPLALQGRVPTHVVGTVRKGDMMVAAGNGKAKADNNPKVGSVIGKALENFDGTEGVIEVVIGRD